MRVNLGSCDRPFEGFVNVDVHPYPGVDQIADLNRKWPWDDNTVSEFRCWDIIEHLYDPIRTMNELWRCLRPGGIADIIVPTTDGRGWAQDPTHKCFPPFNRNSFLYYTHGDPHNRRFNHNGVQAGFNVLRESEEMLQGGVSKLSILLEAVK